MANLFAPLSDEELASQADEWRYAAERYERERKYGLAAWARRLAIEAADEWWTRFNAAEAARKHGEQLSFDVPGRVAPESR